MEQPLKHLQARSNWIHNSDHSALTSLAQQRYQQLCQLEPNPIVFISESDSISFLAAFIAACSLPCRLFICNPTWVAAEWEQVLELAQPDIVFGEVRVAENDRSVVHVGSPLNPPLVGDLENCKRSSKSPTCGEFRGRTQSQRSVKCLIMIPTGGTSGKIRFAMHTWQTLSASVEGFAAHFGVQQIDCCCVLPLYHVSGLMQVMRSFLTNGQLVIHSWKALEADRLPEIDPRSFFLSLVPTQLQRLIDRSQIDWFSQFTAILLGGAPAWEELLQRARSLSLPIALTYGMTETASQIATLKPSEFLSGEQHCGAVLPHAQITIENDKIQIRSRSLMLGYYPNFESLTVYETNDLGYFDDRNNLHIIGRESNKIITGGENVDATEVESAIRSSGLTQDVTVVGISDLTWGQIVVAIYVPSPHTTIATLQTALNDRLSRYKHPKRWIAVANLPRNAQGKIEQKKVQQLIADSLTNAAPLATP